MPPRKLPSNLLDCVSSARLRPTFTGDAAPDGHTTNVFLDAPVDLCLACRNRRLAAPAHARFHGLHMRFQALSGQHGFITMDLVQCATRSVTVVGGGANPPGSPGLRARRLQALLHVLVVVQVRIHPSKMPAHTPLCT
jgi:hypothetical protein